jgi:AmmeMemoRadiSam system protein A
MNMMDEVVYDCGDAHAVHGDPAPLLLTPLSGEDKRLLLRVARMTLEDYLRDGALAEIDVESPALLAQRAAFVTLWRRETDELRGCRGECIPQRPLIESVTLMSIAAAVDDPRFPPVQYDELANLRIEINALSPPHPIRPDEVVVGRHGLMIVRGRHAGLLLPEVPERFGWERVEFLDALCHKAGLPHSAWAMPDTHLFGFESEAWAEER